MINQTFRRVFVSHCSARRVRGMGNFYNGSTDLEKMRANIVPWDRWVDKIVHSDTGVERLSFLYDSWSVD